MISLEEIKELSIPSPSKIVMIIIDGLGGLPDPSTGKTELETAQTPNFDRLAREGLCGLIDPVSPGVTPGSAPGQLALLGYDPFRFSVGRGILEALGVDFALQPSDVAARGNFCTIDTKGLITDRRAGRISSEKGRELCHLLDKIRVGGVELFVVPVKEHRFAVVLRGKNLSAELSDSDPLQPGLPPREIKALSPRAKATANSVNKFVTQARENLKTNYPANMILLRGFSKPPSFPSMSEIYKLKAAAIATYPMYKGLARLLKMEVLKTEDSFKDQVLSLSQHYANYDFFFLHVKATDIAGEDGNFESKVKIIEEVDSSLPSLLELKPEVLVVTGDHSTPALLKGHSWHPVPFVLYSRWCRPSKVQKFSERGCALGELGRFPALDVMPLVMANALKLEKFGA